MSQIDALDHRLRQVSVEQLLDEFLNTYIC